MIEKTYLRHASANPDAGVGVSVEKSGIENSTSRLREAVRLGGGPKAVAAKTGIPVTTLQGYLSGGEMKLTNAIALARATGVHLDWLATGEGPMRERDVASASPPLPAPMRLFGNVKIDRLIQAYEGALASAGGDRRLTMHLTVVMHDALLDAQESKSNQTDRSVTISTQNTD